MEQFNVFAVIASRLVAAAGCAALLGWERKTRHKPAGVRTYMLVAVGAAAFTLASQHLVTAGSDTAKIDPTRVVAGIVGGIGFLGAGSILRGRDQVRGLTTAAGIWVTGSIGVAAGLGEYALAISTAILAFMVMHSASFLEKRADAPGAAGSADTAPNQSETP